MSHVEDLKDLIRTASDIYLINSSHNAWPAYTQIDDLCELILATMNAGAHRPMKMVFYESTKGHYYMTHLKL